MALHVASGLHASPSVLLRQVRANVGFLPPPLTSLSPKTHSTSRRLSTRKDSRGEFRSCATRVRAGAAEVAWANDEVASVPTTQKGWRYFEYGSVEVLNFGEDLPVPSLTPDQVLIRVAAAGLNPVDFKRREGKFQASDSSLPTTPGYDVAGVVVAVGDDVTKFKKGDQVYSNISEAALNQPKQSGSLAQFTATEEKLVALKPSNLTFVQAAAIPLAALTAQEGFDRAGFQPGESVLILNGAGGVGTFAIQLAKHVYGAGFIAATGSAEKAPLMERLGADLTIDYKSEKYWERSEKFDFVLDCIGDGPNAIKALKPSGRAKLLTGAIPEGGQAERFVVTSRGSKLEELTPYFEKGVIKPVLDPLGPFPFREGVEAFAHLETGHATGKIVVGPVE